MMLPSDEWAFGRKKSKNGNASRDLSIRLEALPEDAPLLSSLGLLTSPIGHADTD